MNAQNFCYWLQGYSEIDGQLPNTEQWRTILDHLTIVEELKDKFSPLELLRFHPIKLPEGVYC